MDIYLRRLGIDRIKPRSILVGGGTPTYLTPEQLTRFLEAFTSASTCREHPVQLRRRPDTHCSVDDGASG